MADTVIVRFAPSPTGTLHIGGLRTALFNWLWARKHQGTFILRIEDTDQKRKVPGSLENIQEALQWYGLSVDSGPIFQSERIALYRKYADQLVNEGKAYYSFETPERLEELRKIQRLQHTPIKFDALREGISDEEAAKKVAAGEPHVVRLRIPREGESSFVDEIYGSISIQNSELDDQILMKSDGFPTYHLANVVDDHDMGVTHVIRGEEWLPSTPKHIYLYDALGWQPPVFAHLPMILGPDKAKLSKRHGAAAALDYRDQGFLPQAVLNFIALLGWNPKDDSEEFTLDDLVARFDLRQVNKSSAVFDVEKLEWLNGHYIRTMPVDELWPYAKPFLKEYADQPNITSVLDLARERVRKLSDLADAVSFFYAERLDYDPSILIPKKEDLQTTISALGLSQKMIAELAETSFDHQALRKEFETFISQNNLTNKQVLWPLRVAVSGRTASPGVFEIMALLGKEVTLSRVDFALEQLKKM